MVSNIFSCAFWPSGSLLRRSVYLGLMPVFLLGFVFFDIELHELLCIIEINPLSAASFANIFSHSKGCLFVCLRFPWRRKWQPPPVFLPGKSHRRWWPTVHRVAKSQTRLSDFTSHTLCGVKAVKFN